MESRKPVGNPFGIVQAIKPDDEGTRREARYHAFNERQSHRTLRQLGESRRLDPDWKHVNTDGPTANNEIEIATVQPAFAREVTVEVKSIVPGLESDEIVIAQRSNESVRTEFVINLKTAKALGVTVPHGLLNAADEVIE